MGGNDKEFERVNERFDEVNRRIREGHEDTNRRFDGVDKRFDRIEGDIVELKQGVASVQATLNRIGIGLALTFASVLGTILAKGL